MTDLTRMLRSLGVALPSGLSEAALAELEQSVGARLPDDLAGLYRDHNGTPVDASLPMRLMSDTEVGKTDSEVRASRPNLLADQAALFWTDDNSNYAGVFLQGPLSPRVFLLDHEEPDDSPRFTSVSSFVAGLLANRDRDWTDLSPDYPALDDPPADRANRERVLGQRFLEAYLDNPQEARPALLALALLPPSDTNLLLPLLESEDFWVQERTCQVLGSRRYADAIGELLEVARHGHRNGRIASIRALQNMRNREAAKALKSLQRELGERYRRYFMRV